MLLVEPSARGLGLGAALVDECERFARHSGLPDDPPLDQQHPRSPRARIYQKAGYRLVASEAHHSFGHDLVGETWELRLR